MNVTPARTDAEFRALMSSSADAIQLVRTREEWDQTFTTSAEDDALPHPLHTLSQDEIDTFTSRLVFRNGGLAGAWVGDLADRLSEADYRRLWAMFGLDPALLLTDDYEHHMCESPGNCRDTNNYICTSNC